MRKQTDGERDTQAAGKGETNTTKMCKSERNSATGLWMICSLSSMFDNDKIKYSTSSIKPEGDRHVANNIAMKRKQEKVRM